MNARDFRAGGTGRASLKAEPPPASSPPLLPLPYVFGWDCGCAGAGVVLSREPVSWGRSPKVAGGPCTQGAACAGQPGGRGTDGNWEPGPGITCDATGNLARLTRDIYYYIIFKFFLVRQYCAFYCFFSFGEKKRGFFFF